MGKNKKEAADLEPADWRSILTALHASVGAVQEMLKEGQDKCPRVQQLEERTRVLEDSQDHHHQRSLRGKFMISSSKDNNIVKKDKELKEEGKDLPSYVGELVYGKLGVSVKREEIKSCHHTATGIVFRLGDLKPGSGFCQMVSAIKGGQGKDVPNLFINFAMTPRRASLLFEIRQLKRTKAISKFYADYDGSIAIIKEEKGRKIKLTSVVQRGEGGAAGGAAGPGTTRVQGAGQLWTITAEELKERYGGQQV